MALSCDVEEFKAQVWQHYTDSKRRMPWRENTDPYWVLVSEIMLQQTQVRRVQPKFEEFIAAYPSIESLARSPLSSVLQHWSGLGYNRRAKFLHEAAMQIVERHDGVFPDTIEELDALPGVGYNTAAAILTYAFNRPVAFIETNVRTVFLYHFFADGTMVSDPDMMPLVEKSLDKDNPREWYWALMDYGAHLKATSGARLDQSSHYKKQSRFTGSTRQMRGRIVRELGRHEGLDDRQLRMLVEADIRYETALRALIDEGLVSLLEDKLYLTGQSNAKIIVSN